MKEASAEKNMAILEQAIANGTLVTLPRAEPKMTGPVDTQSESTRR
jgi:hypothetical protein